MSASVPWRWKLPTGVASDWFDGFDAARSNIVQKAIRAAEHTGDYTLVPDVDDPQAVFSCLLEAGVELEAKLRLFP